MSICNRCERKGLSILPVLYSVVHNDVAKGLPALTNPLGDQVTNLKLTEHTYGLRCVQPGYIYILMPNKKYRGYIVDPRGYLLSYRDLDLEDMGQIPEESKVEACKKEGHNTTKAQCLTIPTDQPGKIWIAYSRTRWTQAARAYYAEHPSLRMQLIVSTDGSEFPHAIHCTPANLKQWVIDFSEPRLKQVNDRYQPERQNAPKTEAQATQLASTMQSINGNGKPGLIFALWDPIGITQQLNHARNMAAQVLFGVDQGTDAKTREDMTVASVISEIETQIKKENGGWDKHAKYIDQKKYADAKKLLEAQKQKAAAVDRCSADYVQWMSSFLTKISLQNDFDPANKTSGLGFEECFASCVEGSGHTQDEREKIWQPWFDEDATAPTNFLAKAMTANDKALLGYLAWEKVDKTYDLGKGTKDAIKESAWGTWLASVHNNFYATRREFTEATAVIAQTLATQLMWLRNKDRKKFLRVTAQMAGIFLARGDIALVPKNLTAPARYFAKQLHNHIQLKPKSHRIPLKVGQTGPNSPKAIKPSDVRNGNVQQELHNMGGTLMLDLGSEDKIIHFTEWFATRLKPGGGPDPELERVLKKIQLTPQDVVLKDIQLGRVTEHQKNMKVARVDMAFSVGVVFVQLIAAYNTMCELTDLIKKDKLTDEEKYKQTKAWASLGGTAMTLISVGMDVKAAQLTIQNGGKVTDLAKTLAKRAAFIGLAVGLMDAYFLWQDAGKLEKAGDREAAEKTKNASGATAFGAITGFVGTILVASSLVLVGIGLIVISVSAFVAAMYYNYSAAEAIPTPLQMWLDRCRFGSRLRKDSANAYKTLEEEMEAFRDAIYSLSVSWQMYCMQGLRYVESKLLVPFYGKHSRVEVTLTGVDALGREVALKTIRLEHGSKNNTGTNTPKQIVKDESTWNVEKQQVLTVLLDVGLRDVPQAVSTDKDHIYYRYSSMDNRDITNDAPFYKAAKLAVKYMPDTEMWPNFAITTQKGVE